MSDIYGKVRSISNICGIEIATKGDLIPSSLAGYQQFYNSFTSDTDFKEFYSSKVAVGYDEESEITSAGTQWRQKLVFRFPSSDGLRAERLVLMTKVKFIKIKLTNKQHFVLGRNDFHQNAPMKLKIKSNEKLSQVEFESVTIFPTGYTPFVGKGGLPEYIPLNFINP